VKFPRPLLLLALTAALAHGQALAPGRAAELRSEIRRDLSIPDPLPALDAHVHRHFAPASGVAAEGVSYVTQFGTRVPAILYLPDPLPAGKIPGIVVVSGHGGDKYSWYSFYTGILYARAGAAVLTYDQIGEGERNLERKSNTRAHDAIVGDEPLGRRLTGSMVTDILQGVSYLSARPEVDPSRIGVYGFSMGSFMAALAGAVDPRPRVCVLVGGGNLTVGPGHWDGPGHLICQGWAYRSLKFLGDRPATLYALQADRGPTLVWNGRGDKVVEIAKTLDPFFSDLRSRVIALRGSDENVFEFGFTPVTGHQPYFLTKPVALWLQRQLHFPNWTEAGVAAMPETAVGDWAQANGLTLGAGLTSPAGPGMPAGGLLVLGRDFPGYAREDLSVFSPSEWEAVKSSYILETWVTAARAAEQPEKAGH
jgi:dienelactone hydrolase